MSKFYSGQDGQMFVADGVQTIDTNSDSIAKVRSWSFTINTSVLETVSLGDFDRTIIPGVSSTTGSCSVYYYADTSSDHNSGLLSSVILKKILPRNGITPVSEERPKVRFRLQVDSNHYIDMNAVITSFNMTNAVGEIMAADVTFEADGIPTESRY